MFLKLFLLSLTDAPRNYPITWSHSYLCLIHKSPLTDSMPPTKRSTSLRVSSHEESHQETTGHGILPGHRVSSYGPSHSDVRDTKDKDAKGESNLVQWTRHGKSSTWRVTSKSVCVDKEKEIIVSMAQFNARNKTSLKTENKNRRIHLEGLRDVPCPGADAPALCFHTAFTMHLQWNVKF